MISVLFLINNLGSGGAERVLVNLVNNIDINKYKVTVRTLVDEGENKRDLSKNVIYEYVFKKGFRGINYLNLLPKKYIYNKVAHGDFDVIIVYLHGVLTKIISYAPKNAKTIAYLHANMEKSPFIKSFQSKQDIQRCFNSYDAIVAVSEQVKESFERVSGIKNKLHVIYNAFDITKIKSLSKEQLPRIDAEGINICSVGKLNKVKGYDRLLKVIKRLREESFKFQLTIVGDGPQKKELLDYIEENHLVEYVSLVGFDYNPYKYIARSDLFVCASYSEGFSSVVVESMVLGTPVITTDCAGMKEILGNNNNYGIIVDNEEESLYLGLKDIITNREKLQYYKQKAIERSKYFDTSSSVKAVESLIDEVVK